MATEPTPADQEDGDEISLADIVRFFVENGAFLLKGLAAGMIAGLLYIGLVPTSFKASASIQMATVNGDPVETPAVLVEKMKLPLYFSVQTWNACDSQDNLHPSRSLAKKLNPTVNRNAPFVSMTFTAKSPAAAVTCLRAVFKEVQSKQKELAEPMIKLGRANLQALKDKQAQAQEFLRLLPQVKVGTSFSDTKFPAMALLISTSMAKESEVRELQLEITEAELKLAAPNTQDATLPTEIFAPDSPAGLEWWMACLIAAAIGFFIAGCWVFLRKALAGNLTTVHGN